uniref:Diaminopropionate ammonia-lyase n=1 Tax=Talaromyces marneffei PM1 TaxID=1077442 RepID=A0A093V621_TALMA
MSAYRKPVLFQETTVSRRPTRLDLDKLIYFHRGLPGYSKTRLIDLPELAMELNVRNVFMKDESDRFGLPSFKILGASWGTFTAICSLLGLPQDSSLDHLLKEATSCNVKLFAATDGNHGRAVARMGRLLSLITSIYVPSDLEDHAKQLISGEGAQVITYDGDYDGAVQAATKAAEITTNGLLIQDTSFPGYEDIPSSITQGYSTIFREVDDELQLRGLQVDVIVTPVGVGSLAHAVVQHYKTLGMPETTRVVTVEPDTAACFYRSLQRKNPAKISTAHTIMTGMNCGTVSHGAWQDLCHLVDASLTVSDFEAHQAVQYLRTHKISSGPCGASSVAALRRLTIYDRAHLGLHPDTVIVLLNTEGDRPYDTPLDVSTDDPVELTRLLTRIQSTNLTLASTQRTRETYIVDFIEAWLQHRDIESCRLNQYLVVLPSSGLFQGGYKAQTSCLTAIQILNQPQFRFKRPCVLFSRSALKLDSGHPFERLAAKAAENACEQSVKPIGLRFRCDTTPLDANGIPTVVFGPTGDALPSDEEWMDVESIRKTERMISSLVAEFCG